MWFSGYVLELPSGSSFKVTDNMYQVASILDAQDTLVDYWEIMAKAGKKVVDDEKKPVLVAIPDVAYPGPRADAWNIFVKYGLPVFQNVKQAVMALDKVRSYYEVAESRK